MVIIWKGFGIIVPIILVGIGLLTSLFFDDKTLGNTTLLGWTFLTSSILFILLGIGFSSSGENEDSTKKSTLWHHTFFFLPILFWGIILLGFSIYFLLIYNPNPTATNFETDFTEETLLDEEDETTLVSFYNPTGDTLVYIFADENGNTEKVKLGGYESDYQYTSGEENQAYLIGAMTLDGVTTLMISPEYEKNYDKTKFISVKDAGNDILLRKIRKPTKEKNDYDDVWVILDKEFDMALIDVSSLYTNGKLNVDLIKKVNWADKIVNKYDGNDVIEVKVSNPDKNGFVEVVSPNTVFPEEVISKTKVYFLAEYMDEDELTNKYITAEIIRLATDE